MYSVRQPSEPVQATALPLGVNHWVVRGTIWPWVTLVPRFLVPPPLPSSCWSAPNWPSTRPTVACSMRADTPVLKITCHGRAKSRQHRCAITSTHETSARLLSCFRRSSREGATPGKDAVVGSADVAPALGNCEDQVLFPENGQGTARGRACHRVRLSDLRFGDPAARGQLARANLIADDLRNLEVGAQGRWGRSWTRQERNS